MEMHEGRLEYQTSWSSVVLLRETRQRPESYRSGHPRTPFPIHGEVKGGGSICKLGISKEGTSCASSVHWTDQKFFMGITNILFLHIFFIQESDLNCKRTSMESMIDGQENN